MPAHPRPGLHNPMLGRFFHQGHAGNFHFQHHGMHHIATQNDIAAPTQHQAGAQGPLRGAQNGTGGDFLHRLGAGQAHQHIGTGGNTKGIQIL